MSIQSSALRHMLHYNTLRRIVDSEMYGNEYDISTFMGDLNNAIFKADINNSVNTFRQNLQLMYTEMLINMVTGKQSAKYDNVAQSHAIYFLKEIKKMASNGSGDISTKAHKSHLVTLIDNTMKEIK
jgi:hypothetical protein